MKDQVTKIAKKRIWLIVGASILVLFIVGVLAMLVLQSGMLNRAGNVQVGLGPGEATVAAPAASGTAPAAETGTTPTATKVVKEATAPSEPTNTPKPKLTATPTKRKATPKPTNTPKPTSTPTPAEPEMVNVVRNGGFEWGFGDDGVAYQWERFTNEGAKYLFAAEGWPLAIRNGQTAQRITVFEAHQPDRYAGIYQIVPVVPGEAYWLTLHGQIRSKAGDIAASRYGYRMQYAIDWQGGTDWQAIPADEWVELPWDEQLLDSPDVQFQDFSRNIVPPNGRLTLFVRAWNKWPDPQEAQYTLDTISLVGPKPQDELFDQPLPATGGSTGTPLSTDPRFWGSLLFLLFLLGGAAWRFRRRPQMP